MAQDNDLPQHAPTGARGLGEPNDAERDRRPFGGQVRRDSPEGDIRPVSDSAVGTGPRVRPSERLSADCYPSQPVPEAIARWEGEGGRPC